MAIDKAPAADAAAALGGMMQGESSPFPSDDGLSDHSNDIASIFGLGEEAGPVPNSSESSSGGGASPPASTPAAEGGGEQVQQPATPPTPLAQPGQQGDQSQAPAQPQAPAAPPAAPAQPEPAPQQPDSLQALTAQVQALIAQNAQLQAQMAQGGAQPQPASSGQPAQDDPDPNMDYRFGIPDDVAAAIFNEDATIARNGMAHLVNSIGRVIHERVLKSVTERVLPRELQNFQQQTQLTTQQEQMRQEYFKAFPQHNDPGIRLIVAQEAQTMWTLNPTMQWDDNARNALGARVHARLGGTPQLQQPPAQVNAVPQPAPMLDASNRPPVPADTSGDFITDVLSA